MSKLRTYQLQNPDSATVNIELDQSGGTTVSGILTASSGVVGNVTGNVTGTATTATNLADAANITTGTLSNDRLPATITKNLSGNVTGNVTGNLTGNVTGGITTSQITIGDAFIKAGAVGVGTTDTAGRNAGVGTAVGTIIFNSTTLQLEVYSPAGWMEAAKVPFAATGGTESTSSRDGYKVHTFTGDGSITATQGTVVAEYLVIAGGAGSPYFGSGGAGAGGYRTGTVTLSTGTYPIQVGGGGVAGVPGSGNERYGGEGVPSFITGPVGFSSITSTGGGTSGSDWIVNGSPGGSGGGAGTVANGNAVGGSGNAGGYTPPEGNDGGNQANSSYVYSGGGGGAGGAGQDAQPGDSGDGGPGQASSITGSSVTRAGGGGGGMRSGFSGSGGSAGPGGGGVGSPGGGRGGSAGSPNTGGGAGGCLGYPDSTAPGFAGGSGIVIIAYPTS